MDELKKKVNKVEGILKVKFGNSLRYLTATLSSLTVNMDTKDRAVVRELSINFISKTPDRIANEPYTQTENIS